MSDKHLDMHINFLRDCRERGTDRLLYRAWYFKLCDLFNDGSNPMLPDEGPTLNILKLDEPLRKAIGDCFMSLENDYYRVCSNDEKISIHEYFHHRFLKEEFCKVQRKYLDLKENEEWIEKDLSPPDFF